MYRVPPPPVWIQWVRIVTFTIVVPSNNYNYVNTTTHPPTMFRAHVFISNNAYACVHSYFLCRWRCLVEVRQANGDSPRSSASRTIPIHPHTRQPGVHTHICLRGFVNSILYNRAILKGLIRDEMSTTSRDALRSKEGQALKVDSRWNEYHIQGCTQIKGRSGTEWSTRILLIQTFVH